MRKQVVRPADRQTVLTQRRRMKMAAESAHAYVRGNTLKFYEWLKSARAIESIAAGPPVWICGDCNIGWSSVLELDTTHESAYLDRCRLYALNKDAA